MATMSTTAFDHFNADSNSHDWANAYLLMLANYYNAFDFLDVLNYPKLEQQEEFEKRYKNKFKPWGMTTFDFIVRSRPFQYDTEAVVMSNEAIVIVSFRGSEGVDPISLSRDWISTNLNAKFQDVPELGDGVKAHTGFWRAFKAVTRPEGNTDGIEACLKRQGAFSGKKLWLTGHSLGGVVASMGAIWLRSKGYDVQGVYTYGSPRGGNDAFRDRYQNHFQINCQRWVNQNDLVPMIAKGEIFGLFGEQYHHVGVINNIKEDRSIVLNDQEYEGMGDLSKHRVALYMQGIYDKLAPSLKAALPPFGESSAANNVLN